MNEKPEEKPEAQSERLARFLAHAGIASRRHAEDLISSGRVQVNGQTITAQGSRVDPEHDRVSVDGRLVSAATRLVYVLLNKPAGYVSTAHDPEGRPTVLDLLPPELRQLRVYPVGRLDIDTAGMLLLTNDGDFALHLTHPRYVKEKHYEALAQGHPSPAVLDALRQGVRITEDAGRSHLTAPARVSLLRHSGTASWMALTIHEGHKRQIRRMFDAVGHPVEQLRRVGIGELTLTGVPTGAWRYLTEGEVALLLREAVV